MKIDRLKLLLNQYLLEYWGEPSGNIVKARGTLMQASTAAKTQQDDTIPDDMIHPDDEDLMLGLDGVYVEKDVRDQIRKYMKAMKLLPSELPGKTIK